MPTTWTRRVDPAAKAVYVTVVIDGPTGRSGEARFVVDTGTPVTILNTKLAPLYDLGEDRSDGASRLWGPTGPDDGYRVTTGSLQVMGRTLMTRQIRCHHIWAGAGVDGLIGLDIIRLGRLTVDLPWGTMEFKWN